MEPLLNWTQGRVASTNVGEGDPRILLRFTSRLRIQLLVYIRNMRTHRRHIAILAIRYGLLNLTGHISHFRA